MISKKILTLFAVLSLFLGLSGCSFDQRYRYEVNGNEDYLHTSSLKPMVVPKGFSLPTPNDEYDIDDIPTQGATGLNIDIFPPSLPLATLPGSVVDYRQGIAFIDISGASFIWEQINALLTKRKIPVVSRTKNEIITDRIVSKISPDIAPFTAVYRIYYKKEGSWQRVSVELVSLFMGKKNVLTESVYKQRYTVNFLNWILLALKKDQPEHKHNLNQN